MSAVPLRIHTRHGNTASDSFTAIDHDIAMTTVQSDSRVRSKKNRYAV